jgi:hypothetical protein
MVCATISWTRPCVRSSARSTPATSTSCAGSAAWRASELDKVTRDLDRLVQAILDGVPGSRVKDRMLS